MNIFSYGKNFILKRDNLYALFTFLLLGILLISYGLITAFSFSPDDYLQGFLVKIMYIHVPCAWLSLFLYTMMAFFSLIYLIKKIQLWDLIANSISEVVFVLTLVTLITGSIWGKPAWGTWWVWDARLSSMMILLFLILSYIIVRRSYGGMEVASKICSIISVVGAVNIPIIKFSVNLWSTLHQPSSVFKLGGPSIHYTMLFPMLIVFLGMLFFSMFIIMIKVKTEIYMRKARRY